MADEAIKDKELGMDREITRRDFLNGVAIGVRGSLLSTAVRPEDLLAAGVLDDFAPEKAAGYYPPALMGMRGNHDGTYTFAHRLRDGEAPDSFGKAEDTREHYDLNRAGRYELFQTPFSHFEQKIRDQLARMLGGTGFDSAKDIEGITVNRWAHGYAFTPNSLFDSDWKEEEKPWVIGRKPFGRITIANSDAGANAYTNEAIDQAYRAVDELPRS